MNFSLIERKSSHKPLGPIYKPSISHKTSPKKNKEKESVSSDSYYSSEYYSGGEYSYYSSYYDSDEPSESKSEGNQAKPDHQCVKDGEKKILDRYMISTPRTYSPIKLLPIYERTNHFLIHWDKIWKKGVLHRRFTMNHRGETSMIYIAQALLTKTFSRKIKVSNPRGLVGEIKITKKRTFITRIGNSVMLKLKKIETNTIIAEFFEIDGFVPPFILLASPPSFAKNKFGNRPAIPSIKNCILCDHEKEIISVRKVSKNDLCVDANGVVSYLTAFSVGLFMFLQKKKKIL